MIGPDVGVRLPVKPVVGAPETKCPRHGGNCKGVEETWLESNLEVGISIWVLFLLLRFLHFFFNSYLLFLKLLVLFCLFFVWS